MKYLFLKRGADSSFPIDIVEVEGGEQGYYKILRIIKNNDPKMHYVKCDTTNSYHWMCGVDDGYDTFYQGIQVQRYDKMYEFDNDEAALLLLEVLKNE